MFCVRLVTWSYIIIRSFLPAKYATFPGLFPGPGGSDIAYQQESSFIGPHSGNSFPGGVQQETWLSWSYALRALNS